MDKRNEGIIKKVQGLLAIANDQKNDEESQSAFMLAQRLMMKHGISQSDVAVEGGDSAVVEEGNVTIYKKLYWWERRLAQIISKNFRVKHYYNSKHMNGHRAVKRTIVFMGLKQDIELAKEMYILAYEVLTTYANNFVEMAYADRNYYVRSRKTTFDFKNSYMRGFLSAMNEKFEAQVAELKQEFGLMVLTPEAVVKKYDEMFPADGNKPLKFEMPNIEEIAAYQRGYADGEKIDYTKSTLDGELGEI